MAAYEMKPVGDDDVLDLLRPRGGPGRTSLGRQLVERFVEQGQNAALISFPDRKARDAASLSIKNHLKTTGNEALWVRAVRGTNDLLVVDVPKSSAEVQAQHRAWLATPRGRPRGSR